MSLNDLDLFISKDFPFGLFMKFHSRIMNFRKITDLGLS